MKLLESVVQKSGSGIHLLPPVDTVDDAVFAVREPRAGRNFRDDFEDSDSDVNPATGYPVMADSGMDILGNPSGFDEF
ncbi:hypothetical protein ACJU26_09120 [Acidithiobacillus sp. M4-SHS-6]|uniref:hypothetical protein n=1 Tax=Acidithiobacillus sp. M4-SHS-6 TaxID=3383024 RepID=UPI0039BEBE02